MKKNGLLLFLFFSKLYPMEQSESLDALIKRSIKNHAYEEVTYCLIKKYEQGEMTSEKWDEYLQLADAETKEQTKNGVIERDPHSARQCNIARRIGACAALIAGWGITFSFIKMTEHATCNFDPSYYNPTDHILPFTLLYLVSVSPGLLGYALSGFCMCQNNYEKALTTYALVDKFKKKLQQHDQQHGEEQV